MPKNTISETQLVKVCLEILRMKKIFSWRNNSGSFSSEYKGKTSFVRFGSPGSPDIIGIMPDGKFLGIECKVGKNTLSLNQKLFKIACENANGIYWVIYTPEELLFKLQ